MKCILLFIGITCVTLFFSCKKDKNDSKAGNGRIAGISNPAFSHTYHYDEQNRLVGIDYSISSKMKVAYSASGMVLQWYDGTDSPTKMRTEMNVVDGRVTDAIEINDNFSIQHDYNYDSEGRMQQARATKRSVQNNQTVNKGESKFTWNGSLLSNVTLQVWDANSAKTDSIIWDMSYYKNKKYFTWDDVGFSFFGKAPVGGLPNGMGWRLPVNFLSEGYIPSSAAVKEINRKSFFKQNGQWQMSSGKQTYTEAYYNYDARGRINNLNNMTTIVWN